MQKFCMWLAGVVVLSICSAAAQETPKNVLMLDTGGHMALIMDIGFTPDGRQLVSASDDKTIRVWDLAKGKTVRTIRGEIAPGNPGKIYAMALSPDGKWLAAGGWFEGSDNEIRLYDFASGKLAALLKGHENVVDGLAFSPDGRQLISGSGDSTAIIWDLETRQLKHRLRGHGDHIYAVGFTPDGQRVVTGSYDNDLRLWRVADGGEIAHMTGHGDKVRSLAVAPDGTIASGDDSGEIRLWDGKTGALQKVLAQQGTVVGSLSFSPDGKTLLSSCGQGHPCHDRVFNVETGKELATRKIDDNIVLATAISPDGRWAATGGGSKREIHIWDLRTGERRPGPDGQPLALGGQGQPVWAVGFSADGWRISWRNSGGWNNPMDRGPLEYALTLPSAEDAFPRPFSFTEATPPHPDTDASALSREGRGQDGSASPHPNPLPQGEGGAQAPGEGVQSLGRGDFLRAAATHGGWSLEHRKGGVYGYDDAILDIKQAGRVVQSIELSSTDGLGHSSYSFTPDGETIISGGGNGWLTAYDRAGNKLGEFTGHEGDVWAVAPSPDGRFLVSGSADQTVRLWNLKTYELLVTLFHGADGEWVMWTPEGFFVSSENGGRLVGWQINQGPDKEARYVTADQVRKLFFRPDLVAAKIAGENDKIRQEAERLDIDAILNSGPAPEIAIVTPGDGWQADDNKIKVKVKVTDQGGGVGRVELRVNGAVKTSYGRPGLIDFDVEFAAQDNVIEIVAYNSKNFIASEPARLTVKVDPKTLLGVPNLYVLAVGVNQYKDLRRSLDHAVSDAQMLGETLAAAGHEYYRNPPEVITLKNDEVTVARMGQVFEELGNKVKAGDVFLFFIAGHGKTLHGDYYFVPPALASFADTDILDGGFGPDQWREWFGRIDAEKSVFIFDTCESGSASRIFTRGGSDYATAHRRLIDATGRVTLMAASEQELAIEGYRGHGVFTYAILEALAESDSNGNDQIELMELIKHVDARVPEISRELKACRAGRRGGVLRAGEYCQKPEVDLYPRPFYTLVPRYREVLARIDERMESESGAVIPPEPTHGVLEKMDVLERAGSGNVVGALGRGDRIRVVRKENGWLLVAERGVILGYVPDNPNLFLEFIVE